MALDTFDDFRPSGRSPRLMASVESILHTRRSSEVSAKKPSPAKLRRLRRLRLMAIIHACRTAPVPVPYSTLVEGLGISMATTERLYRLASQMKLRRSRV